MKLIDSIKSPNDIKDFSTEKLIELCNEVREYLIYCCSQNPGHLGASLGTVELTVALHYIFNTPDDKIVWDVGHQAYTHKILTGRKEDFLKNRQKDGISGFPKMSESQYDAFGTGHSSTSIAAALGMAVASDIKGEKRSHIAVIGDGAMTGGLAYEGLNYAGSLNKDILIILNDNQISIDNNTGALHNYLLKITTSKQYNEFKNRVWNSLGKGSFREQIQKIVKNAKRTILKTSETGSLFDSLGCRYFGPIDGHNMEQLIYALSRLKEIPGPKLLHVVTVKGKGYKPAESNQTIWHAPGLFDPDTGERVVGDSNIARYQDVFGETMCDLCKLNDKIVGITPAMASGCGMNILAAKYPEKVFDVGIAEQCAVTFSAGLASQGMIPYCNIYSSFMQRSYDNAIHDVALQRLKVIFTLDRAGLVGEDGATHQGAFDMSSFRPIPNVVIASPLNELELRNMLYSAIDDDYKTPIIRYPRGKGVGVKWKGEPFTKIEVGKGELLYKGVDVAILSIGPIGNRVSKAIEMLKDDGYSPTHYNMRFLKPIDEEILHKVCQEYKAVVTVEDGSVIGGLKSAVAEFMADNDYDLKFASFGIPDKFIEQASQDEQYDICGYNTSNIYKGVKEIFGSLITKEKKSEKK